MQLRTSACCSILNFLIHSTGFGMNTLSPAFSGGAIVILVSTVALAGLALVSVTTLIGPLACILERYLGLV